MNIPINAVTIIDNVRIGIFSFNIKYAIIAVIKGIELMVNKELPIDVFAND